MHTEKFNSFLLAQRFNQYVYRVAKVANSITEGAQTQNNKPI